MTERKPTRKRKTFRKRTRPQGLPHTSGPHGVRILGPMESFVPSEVQYSKWMDTPTHDNSSLPSSEVDFGFGYGSMYGSMSGTAYGSMYAGTTADPVERDEKVQFVLGDLPDEKVQFVLDNLPVGSRDKNMLCAQEVVPLSESAANNVTSAQKNLLGENAAFEYKDISVKVPSGVRTLHQETALSGDKVKSSETMTIRILGPMESFIPPEVEYSKWMDTPKNVAGLSGDAPDFGFGYGSMSAYSENGTEDSVIDRIDHISRGKNKFRVKEREVAEKFMSKICSSTNPNFSETRKANSSYKREYNAPERKEKNYRSKRPLSSSSRPNRPFKLMKNFRPGNNKAKGDITGHHNRKRKRDSLGNRPHKFRIPQFKIRILTPMIPVPPRDLPRPLARSLSRVLPKHLKRNRYRKRGRKSKKLIKVSPGPRTPAAPETPFDPYYPYNSSAFLMQTVIHPPLASADRSCSSGDDGDAGIFGDESIFGYGSMDFTPCEKEYGTFMDSPPPPASPFEDSSETETLDNLPDVVLDTDATVDTITTANITNLVSIGPAIDDDSKKNVDVIVASISSVTDTADITEKTNIDVTTNVDTPVTADITEKTIDITDITFPDVTVSDVILDKIPKTIEITETDIRPKMIMTIIDSLTTDHVSNLTPTSDITNIDGNIDKNNNISNSSSTSINDIDSSEIVTSLRT